MDANKALPSPGDTPPLASDPASPTNSRKRQRTRSMESAESSASASASAKRSVADHDPDSIDTYMDAQGANQIEPFDPQPAPSSTAIPPHHKLSTIRSLKASPIQLDQTWYLVSATWWNRWVRACSGEQDKNGPLHEYQLGPVDNADLLDELGHLKQGLIEGIDVEYLPEPAWNQLIQWCAPLSSISPRSLCLYRYGHPSIHLPRKAISRGVSNAISLELHPPRFRVLKLAKSTLSPTLAGPSHPYATVSSQDTVSHLIQSLAKALTSEPITVNFRVWKVDPADDAFNRVEFPAAELSSSQAKILEQSTQTVENAFLVSDDAFVVEFQENNEWLVDAANLPIDRPTAPAPGPLFSSGTGFFDKIESTSVFRPKENNYRMGFSNSFTNTRLERKVEPGTLGLGNM
jgi:ubiquitin carboxyl-terminal hydrolase 4/11